MSPFKYLSFWIAVMALALVIGGAIYYKLHQLVNLAEQILKRLNQ